MSDFANLLLLIYMGGLSGYLAVVCMACFTATKMPWGIKVKAILCAPIWPIIVGAIIHNRRSK